MQRSASSGALQEDASRVPLKRGFSDGNATVDLEAQLEEEKWAFNLIAYSIMMLLGLGILLPWNVALNSFDFLDAAYGTQFNFWLSGAYVWPQVVILIVMVKYGRSISFTLRIVSTFLLQCVLGIAIPFIVKKEVWSEWVVLVCIFLFGVCAAVLQSSLVGFSSQFPTVFNQSLMAGQGVAGILAGVLRIATKAAMPEKLRESAIMYFSISSGFMVLCTVAYLYLLCMPFTQHHMNLARRIAERRAAAEARGATLTSPGATAPRAIVTPSTAGSKQGLRRSGSELELAGSLESAPSLPGSMETKGGLSTPLLESRAAAQGAGGDSAPLLPPAQALALSPPGEQTRRGSADTLMGFAATPLGLKEPQWREGAPGTPAEEEGGIAPITVDRESNLYIWEVVKRCWKACLGLWLCYFLTFFVFPSESATIQYQGQIKGAEVLGTNGWWGIVMIGTFNIFDTIGRFAPGFPGLRWVRYHTLPWFSIARVSLIVLMIGAARHWTDAFTDVGSLLIMAFFAFTNGYTTTSSFMAAPEQVHQQDKETAGFIMSFFLLFGMFSGTMAALSLS